VPVATAFFDYALLYEHFWDHGSDFGAKDEYDYQERAREFLNADLAVRTTVQECIRARNGDVIRFDRTTDEYGVIGYDGIIKTYYKPVPRHSAPPGTPPGKTHGFLTNELYFRDTCTR
jgi:filamentous hemagglutinin